MKTKLPKIFSLLAACLLLTTVLQAQTQRGLDICGEAAFDGSGRAISMPDANTVAIGAPQNDGNGTDAGHVRIFSWNGSAWVQKGGDIDGEAANDSFGRSISMPDDNTLAIGAQLNDGNGIDAGHVRIFSWNGNAWVQKGNDIDGEAANDYSGYSISMPDANTLAIGAPDNDDTGTNAGHVRIYNWNGSTWVQKGLDIDGEADFDGFGWTVSMPDDNTIAIGAPFNDGNGTDAGQVRIFSWNGSGWVQKGGNINGETGSNQSGFSVSMPDDNTIAIGEPFNPDNGPEAGQVRIFSWNGSTWIQKGSNINGENAGDRFGWSVSMPDDNTVAIGAPNNSNNGTLAGQVRIFSWNGSAWIQKGSDIDGEAGSDQSGFSVSMPDNNTVAIGAFGNSCNDTWDGHVRVYDLMLQSNTDGKLQADKFALYQNSPNPFKDETTIGFYLPEASPAILTITDMSGKVLRVIRGHYGPGYHQLSISKLNATGLLYYKLETTRETATRKMVVLR